MSVMTTATYAVFGLVALGCLTQTWAANSLSRWASYFCFISSSDSPASALEDLKIQVHSEQDFALRGRREAKAEVAKTTVHTAIRTYKDEVVEKPFQGPSSF